MIVDQSTFRAALLNPEAERPKGLTDGAGQPAGRRFDVYRNNVAVSLTEALETAFPVLRKLLGESNFKLLAAAFLRQHPPSSPLMMFYGAAFPAFLEGMEQLAHLKYLGDVARLELALRRAYHAADAAPIAPEALGALAPEELMAARLEFAPAVQLLRSIDGAERTTKGRRDLVALLPELQARHVARASQDPEFKRKADRLTYFEEMDDDDLLRADVIQALMCYDRLDFDDFDSGHAIDFRDYFKSEIERLKPLAEDELIELEPDGIGITAKGRLLLRSIAMVFDRHMAEVDTDKRFSRAI